MHNSNRRAQQQQHNLFVTKQSKKTRQKEQIKYNKTAYGLQQQFQQFLLVRQQYGTSRK
jgi:hypothetical protein